MMPFRIGSISITRRPPVFVRLSAAGTEPGTEDGKFSISFDTASTRGVPEIKPAAPTVMMNFLISVAYGSWIRTSDGPPSEFSKAMKSRAEGSSRIPLMSAAGGPGFGVLLGPRLDVYP
jgi:hypothetical protein